MNRFSPKAIEQLGYYVYVYSNPDTRKPFYVGKGQGNRAFEHLKDRAETEKTQAIEQIRALGKEPLIEILAHGLDETTALKVEAAAMDLLGIQNLTNRQRGHESGLFGRIEASELNARYDHGTLDETDFIDNVVLIKINRSYRGDMLPFELYEMTRGYWKMSLEQAKWVNIALAVYDGMVIEAYRVARWLPAGSTAFAMESRQKDGALQAVRVEGAKRLEFVGAVADERTRDRYVGKSVASMFSLGQANPIRYVMGGSKRAFVDKAVGLLSEIAHDKKMVRWCKNYEPSGNEDAGPDIADMNRRLHGMMRHAYDSGMVPSNYRDIFETIGDEDMPGRKAKVFELRKLTDRQIISIVAMQFRHDHFCEGILVEEYVADGLLLHYLSELQRRWTQAPNLTNAS